MRPETARPPRGLRYRPPCAPLTCARCTTGPLAPRPALPSRPASRPGLAGPPAIVPPAVASSIPAHWSAALAPPPLQPQHNATHPPPPPTQLSAATLPHTT